MNGNRMNSQLPIQTPKRSRGDKICGMPKNNKLDQRLMTAQFFFFFFFK